MSIAKALQDWLETFDGMELRPIASVQTDFAPLSPSTYALAPAGNSLTKTDILGNKTHINNYVFYAREAIAEEADRAENYDFLESLSSWIEQKNDSKDYPALDSPKRVRKITVSNIMLFSIEDNGLGTYQAQIQLTYSDY